VGGKMIKTIDRERFEETKTQFDETLELEAAKWADQFGLDEAQTTAVIRQIEHTMAESTRKLSSEIGAQWAAITGRSGTGTEDMSALDFGVDVSGITATSPEDLLDTPQGMALASSFEAMMGRAITDNELMSLAGGGDVTIEGVPTLEARRFAAEVTNQTLDRMNQYAAIAAQNELDRDNHNVEVLEVLVYIFLAS